MYEIIFISADFSRNFKSHLVSKINNFVELISFLPLRKVVDRENR